MDSEIFWIGFWVATAAIYAGVFKILFFDDSL